MYNVTVRNMFLSIEIEHNPTAHRCGANYIVIFKNSNRVVASAVRKTWENCVGAHLLGQSKKDVLCLMPCSGIVY